jgi:hypothetical protein
MATKAIVLLGSNILLYGLMQGLNNALAPLGLSIYLGGLFIAAPTLILPPLTALIVIILTAFLIDAPLLTPFGSSALLFTLGFYLATIAQRRIHYPLNSLTTGIAFTLNLCLFIGITLVAPETSIVNTQQLQSLFINLVLSQALLLLIAPWFLSLQQSVLYWAKILAKEHS